MEMDWPYHKTKVGNIAHLSKHVAIWVMSREIDEHSHTYLVTLNNVIMYMAYRNVPENYMNLFNLIYQ